MRTISNKQIIGALLAALVILGGGGTASGILIEKNSPEGANEKAIADLRHQHEQDMALVNTRIMALRELMDQTLGTSAANSSKLDILLQLIRDHMKLVHGNEDGQ